jgi:hypothetical protein
MHNLIGILRQWCKKISAKMIPAICRIRLTLAIFTVILIIGIVAEIYGDASWPVIVQRFGWDLTTLEQGHVYAAWLGLFFSVMSDDFYGILLILLLTVGALEYRAGIRLAAFGFFVIGPLVSIVTLLVLWPISNAGVEFVRVALFTPDAGSSTACLVCLGIFLIRENGRWRNILLCSILALLIGLAFQKSVYNIDHLSGLLCGLGTGVVIRWWEHSKAKKTE